MEVTLIDYMGDDLRVANAARVSFNKESAWEIGIIDYVNEDDPIEYMRTEALLSEADQKLIKYLARHNHFTPFTHVQITMREKVPIFVARQRFKHAVGFTYNEVSRRYVDDPPEFYTPDVWRGKPQNAKQGSSDEVIEELEYDEHEIWDIPESPLVTRPIKDVYAELMEYAKDIYDFMIKNGVAPEQARMVLPQSMFTEYYVTGSLSAWARAYKLRSEGHAQKEIQELAGMWNDKISGLKELEYSWKALTE